MASRLSSRPSLSPTSRGWEGPESRPASLPPPLPLPQEGKCQIPCLSGSSGRVGGGVIQPPPQECGARRAFPAITRRGRGWRANGFNYHSDRNAGRLGPCTRHSTGQAHPEPACAGHPHSVPQSQLGGEAEGWPPRTAAWDLLNCTRNGSPAREAG